MSPHELVDQDRKAPHAVSRCVSDGVRHRAGRSRDADFADALDAEHVHMRIVLVDHERLHMRHVGIHGHMIVGEVGIDDPARAVIDDGPLMLPF